MIDDIAIEVLEGERSVAVTPDGLGEPGTSAVPVAQHLAGRSGGAVLFLIQRGDAAWQAEIVLAESADDGDWMVRSISGAMVPSPSSLRESAGDAVVTLVESRVGLGEEDELVAVAGYSLAASVWGSSGGRQVASSPIAHHGFFVLTAVLAVDCELVVGPSKHSEAL
jgi:hypothetical protein